MVALDRGTIALVAILAGNARDPMSWHSATVSLNGVPWLLHLSFPKNIARRRFYIKLTWNLQQYQLHLWVYVSVNGCYPT